MSNRDLRGLAFSNVNKSGFLRSGKARNTRLNSSSDPNFLESRRKSARGALTNAHRSHSEELPPRPPSRERRHSEFLNDILLNEVSGNQYFLEDTITKMSLQVSPFQSLNGTPEASPRASPRNSQNPSPNTSFDELEDLQAAREKVDLLVKSVDEFESKAASTNPVRGALNEDRKQIEELVRDLQEQLALFSAASREHSDLFARVSNLKPRIASIVLTFSRRVTQGIAAPSTPQGVGHRESITDSSTPVHHLPEIRVEPEKEKSVTPQVQRSIQRLLKD